MSHLQKLLREVEPQIRPYKQLAQNYRAQAVRQWVSDNPVPSAAIRDTIREFDKYQGSHNLMVTLGNGYVTINPDHMSFLLLDATIESGAIFAVRALRHLLNAKAASIRMRCLVWGVSVQQRTKLCPGIYLSPAIPEEIGPRFESAVTQFPPHLRSRSSFSVLSTKVKISQPVVEANDAQKNFAPSHEAYLKMRDVIIALRLIGPNPTMFVQRWDDFEAAELNTINPWKGSMGMIHEAIPLIYEGPAMVEASFGKVVRDYLRLPLDFKDKLGRSLDRLNNALLRRNILDRALEAGISLEMLLLSDNLNTEIGYRLALRAGLLVGKTLTDREVARADIKKLYEIRSRAAHGSSKAKPHDREAVKAGLATCASVIRELIGRKGFPIWDKLELGSEPPRA